MVTLPPTPTQPKRSVPFSVPALSLFVLLPEVSGNHSPLFSVSHSLSTPFPMIGCFILGVF